MRSVESLLKIVQSTSHQANLVMEAFHLQIGCVEALHMIFQVGNVGVSVGEQLLPIIALGFSQLRSSRVARSVSLGLFAALALQAINPEGLQK